MNSKLIGAKGEQAVARYLRQNGYKILGANYKSDVGEIDIIAQINEVICFVEVKTRKQGGMFAPSDAVDLKKQENIKGTAASYIGRLNLSKPVRYDIAEVLMNDSGEITFINHIENAF